MYSQTLGGSELRQEHSSAPNRKEEELLGEIRGMGAGGLGQKITMLMAQL